MLFTLQVPTTTGTILHETQIEAPDALTALKYAFASWHPAGGGSDGSYLNQYMLIDCENAVELARREMAAEQKVAA